MKRKEVGKGCAESFPRPHFFPKWQHDCLDLPSALRRAPGTNIPRYNRVGSYGGAERIWRFN